MKSKIVMAYCTFPDRETAENICRILVSEGTIACANVFPPHTAIYRWQNQIQSQSEVGVIMKLNSRKQTALKDKIKSSHPYTTPALVFWAVDDGLPEFLNWVYGQSL